VSQSPPPILYELDLGDVLGRSFSLYKRNFLKYFLVFLSIQAIIGLLTTLVMLAFPIPKLSPTATPQEALNFLPVLLAALFLQLTLTLVVSWLFSSISTGATIRFTSDVLQKGQGDMQASLGYTLSKLPPILAVGLVTGLLTFLGAIALIVPGIILAIMFSLSLPVLLIENAGVLDSMGRSRLLVGNRWLKTFGLLLVLGVIGVAVGIVSSLVSAPFGLSSTLVNSLIAAVYLPIYPITLTVYYYSNRSRLAQPQSAMPWTMPSGFKFCPSCGTQLPAISVFCTKCGTKQPG
jgi:hypothetical protein